MKTIKFSELNISDDIQKAIKDMGFEEATPIQSQAIKPILDGIDIVGQAQTGTGKTAAFGIPILEKINPEDKTLQALVLCPTRELAIQVSEEFRKLSKYSNGIKALPIYGGQPIQRQIKALKKKIQVVIGTPGRVMDHMRRKTLKMDSLKMVVLDEADEMLNMGFREDIETILKDTPDERQTVLFSATMPREILEIAKTYQKSPQTIKVAHKKLTVPSIEQYYFEVKERDKLDILSRLIDIHNPKLALIFCNTKRQVDILTNKIQGRGYFADAIHGDLKQRQRDRVMNSFREGNIEILVATDVAARGIDVDDIEIVFNYDVPQHEEFYVHRIGRTGRAGRAGVAFTFVVGKEIYKLKDIQKYAKTKIKRIQPPTSNDVEEAKEEIITKQIKDILDKENLTRETHFVERLLEEDFTSIEIAAALIKMTINLQEQKQDDDTYDVLEDTGAEPGMVRLFINIGKKHKVGVKDILGAIAGETELPGELVGKIDIFDKFSFVEVPKRNAKDVLKSMKDNKIKGKKINIEPANKK